MPSTADAYLINCSGPEQISEALPLLKQAAGDTPVGGLWQRVRLDAPGMVEPPR